MRHTQAWKIAALVGLTAILVDLLLPAGVMRKCWYDGFGLASAACITTAVVVHRPRVRTPWYLLAVSQALGSCADGLWDVFRTSSNSVLAASGDVFYTAAYPVMAVGLGMLIHRRSRDDRVAGMVDAAIVASSFALLTWVFFIRPALGDTSLSAIDQFSAIGYPTGDVLLLAMTVRMLTGVGERSGCLYGLAVAQVVLFGADVGYSVAGLLDVSYLLAPGSVLETCWLLSYVAFAVAAIHPSMRGFSEPGGASSSDRLTRARFVLLVAATLVAPVLLAFEGISRKVVDAIAIAAASAVLFLLVMVRLKVVMRRLEAQTRQVTALARLDGLTEIPNRRAWDTELPVFMDDARRSGEPLSIGILDLDFFKRFNDEYGHQRGDRLLKASVAAWRAALRPADLLCRYGGEEFGALLPGADGPDAVRILERLRQETPMAQTFSCGVATWDRTESSEQLIGRADRALYAAKHAGRNLIVLDERPERRPDRIASPVG